MLPLKERPGFTYFPVDHFDESTKHWESFLEEFIDIPCQALEVGTYEGRSAYWFLENILTHPDSKITCIDKFLYSDIGAVWNNLSEFGDKSEIISGYSLHVLSGLKKTFDFAYIDGSHFWVNVLQDSELVFRLIKNGGLMIFDDYEFSPDFENTKLGIDLFLKKYSDRVELIHKGWQVIVRKKC